MTLKKLAFLFCFITLSAQAQNQSVTVNTMAPFQLNGFELTGAEYWIFDSSEAFKYPDFVLWGFSGQSNSYGRTTPAPMKARECALVAYNELVKFLATPPPEFIKLKASGVTYRFFLWVNDYTKANDEVPRPSRMWHWNSGPKNYSQGFWKWESTLSASGECITPSADQVSKVIIDTTALLADEN